MCREMLRLCLTRSMSTSLPRYQRSANHSRLALYAIRFRVGRVRQDRSSRLDHKTSAIVPGPLLAVKTLSYVGSERAKMKPNTVFLVCRRHTESECKVRCAQVRDIRRSMSFVHGGSGTRTVWLVISSISGDRSTVNPVSHVRNAETETALAGIIMNGLQLQDRVSYD